MQTIQIYHERKTVLKTFVLLELIIKYLIKFNIIEKKAEM